MDEKSYFNTEWKLSRVKSAWFDSVKFFCGSRNHFKDVTPNLDESSIFSQFDWGTQQSYDSIGQGIQNTLILQLTDIST
jgi:hypothetical protein